MKFNLKTLSLGGLAAFTLLAAPLAIVETARAEGGRHHQVLEQLDLSEDQSARLASLREDTRSQIQAVLSSDQQSQLEAAREAGEARRQAWRSLDLSEEQRDRIRAIREDSRTEFESILTDDQLAQIEEMRQARSDRQGNRHSR